MNNRAWMACGATILLCMRAAAADPAAETTSIRTASGIVFHLPDDWIEIPQQILDKSTRAMHELAPDMPKQVYEYGFQQTPGDPWLRYPYILVQIQNKGRMPEAQLKQFKALNKGLQMGAKQVEEQSNALVTDMKMGEPVYDDALHAVWIYSQSTIAEVGVIDAVIGMRLTEQGFVQIMGYSRHADAETMRPVFERVIRSAELPESLQYKPRFSDNVPRPFGIDMTRVGRSALIGAVIGGVASLLVRLRKKHKSGPAA